MVRSYGFGVESHLMQLFINAAIAGSLAALMAGGLALVYGVLGMFNLALGQVALVGGYLAWWLTSQGVPLLASIPLALVGVAIVAALSFEGFVAPFYKRHRFLPIVTTIALSMVLESIIQLVFHEEPRSLIVARAPITLGTGIISVGQLVLIIATIAFLAGTAYVLYSTPFGRRIRATVQHSTAAESLGIPSAILHRVVFIASSVLAGMAGIFLVIDQNITPSIGFPITIKAYAALIAGGKDNLWAAVGCAYLIALIEQLAVGIPWFGMYIPAGYQSTVALMLIIVMLLVRPQGLFGLRTRIA